MRASCSLRVRRLSCVLLTMFVVWGLIVFIRILCLSISSTLRRICSCGVSGCTV